MNTAKLKHISFWIILYLLWFFMSKNNHPSDELNAIATFILTASTALYAYIFMKGLFAKETRLRAILYLFVVGMMAASLIFLLYEYNVGPDPRRFGLVRNIFMDVGFILLNSLLSNAVLNMANRKTES